jgi:hypothetical protein
MTDPAGVAALTIWGFDTASDTTAQAINLADPSTTINGAPVSFVCRYYDNFQHSTHHLSPAEAQALSDVGLSIVTAWESPRTSSATGDDVWPTVREYFTREWGVQDGLDAFMIAAKVGQPANTPIYFAVDFDLQEADAPALAEYFRGVQDGYVQYHQSRQAKRMPNPDYAVGVYGSGLVLKKCLTQGIVTYFWQSMSSAFNDNAQPVTFANLRQHGGTPLCGIDTDFDESPGNPGSWSLP